MLEALHRARTFDLTILGALDAREDDGLRWESGMIDHRLHAIET